MFDNAMDIHPLPVGFCSGSSFELEGYLGKNGQGDILNDEQLVETGHNAFLAHLNLNIRGNLFDLLTLNGSVVLFFKLAKKPFMKLRCDKGAYPVKDGLLIELLPMVSVLDVFLNKPLNVLFGRLGGLSLSFQKEFVFIFDSHHNGGAEIHPQAEKG